MEKMMSLRLWEYNNLAAT